MGMVEGDMGEGRQPPGTIPTNISCVSPICCMVYLWEVAHVGVGG